jgi:hypothetical protein
MGPAAAQSKRQRYTRSSAHCRSSDSLYSCRSPAYARVDVRRFISRSCSGHAFYPFSLVGNRAMGSADSVLRVAGPEREQDDYVRHPDHRRYRPPAQHRMLVSIPLITLHLIFRRHYRIQRCSGHTASNIAKTRRTEQLVVLAQSTFPALSTHEHI